MDLRRNRRRVAFCVDEFRLRGQSSVNGVERLAILCGHDRQRRLGAPLTRSFDCLRFYGHALMISLKRKKRKPVRMKSASGEAGEYASEMAVDRLYANI